MIMRETVFLFFLHAFSLYMTVAGWARLHIQRNTSPIPFGVRTWYLCSSVEPWGTGVFGLWPEDSIYNNNSNVQMQ